jgi:sec-independent protein translocase protein TatC
MMLVSAIVTPPDLMSMMILFSAIYPLYEVSILIIRRMEKRREAELRAEGLWDEETESPSETPETKA